MLGLLGLGWLGNKMANDSDFAGATKDFLLGSEGSKGKKYSTISENQRRALDSGLGNYGGMNLPDMLRQLSGQNYSVDTPQGSVYNQLAGIFGQAPSYGGVRGTNLYNNTQPFNMNQFANQYKTTLDEILGRATQNSPIAGKSIDVDKSFVNNFRDPIGTADVQNPFVEGNYRASVREGVIDPLVSQSLKAQRDLQAKTAGGSAFSLGSQRMKNEANANLANQIAGINFQTESTIMDKGMQGRMFADQMNVQQRDNLRNAYLSADTNRLNAMTQLTGMDVDAQLKILDMQANESNTVNQILNTYLDRSSQFAQIGADIYKADRGFDMSAYQTDTQRYGMDLDSRAKLYGIDTEAYTDKNQLYADVAKFDAQNQFNYENLQAQNQWNTWDMQMKSLMGMLNTFAQMSTAGTYGMRQATQGSSGLLGDVISGFIGGAGTGAGIAALS